MGTVEARWNYRCIALTALVALTWCVPSVGASRRGGQDEVLVFAAASLTDVLGEIGKDYQTKTGTPVKFSFAASSALARQIEAGARADLFVSADLEWMDYLADRKLIAVDSRRNIAGNRLVLIAPADANTQIDIVDGLDLRAALGDGRLAIADPDIVPAGRYARAALEALQGWSGVSDRLARAENVRFALAYVAAGEAPLGIVYETDARMEPRVRILGAFPVASHPAIRYPAALTTVAESGAKDFLDFLGSSQARTAFTRHGFIAD
jgi:molybdate transport system substrate-binding protein